MSRYINFITKDMVLAKIMQKFQALTSLSFNEQLPEYIPPENPSTLNLHDALHRITLSMQSHDNDEAEALDSIQETVTSFDAPSEEKRNTEHHDSSDLYFDDVSNTLLHSILSPGFGPNDKPIFDLDPKDSKSKS